MILSSLGLAIVMLMSFVPVDADRLDAMSLTTPLMRTAGRIILSLPGKTEFLTVVGVTLIIMAIRAIYQKVRNKEHGKRGYIDVPVMTLAVLFAFSCVFGDITASLNDALRLSDALSGGTQIIKIFCGMLAYTYVSYMLIYAIINSREFVIRTKHDDTIEQVLTFAPIILIAAIGIVMIMTYPGILIPWDSSSQILQFFGYPENTSAYINQRVDGIYINSHHPIIHTLAVGTILDFCHAVFGNYEAGICVLLILQSIVFVLTFLSVLRCLKEHDVAPIIRLVVFLIVLFVPTFIGYAVTLTKDTLFSCLLVLLAIQFDRIHNHGVSIIRSVIVLVYMVLIGLLRSGSIVAVICAGICACVIAVANKRREIALHIASVVAISMCAVLLVANVTFPSLGYSDGSKREMMSIPMQQTAAIVSFHGDDVTSDQRAAIDKVIDYDGLVDKYDPGRSDYVKSTWNKDATSSDINAFLKAWLELVARHPMTAAEATMRNYYEWLYFDMCQIAQFDTSEAMRCANEDRMDDFDITYPSDDMHVALRDVYDGYITLFDRMPIVSIFLSSPFWIWGLLIVTVRAWRRRSQMFPICAALIIMLLIIFIGPINGYNFRYVLPMQFAMTLIAPLLFFCSSGQKKAFIASRHHV